MSANATFTISAQIGGKTIYKTITKSSDHPNPYIDYTLPAGKTVTSWVKTDADTAACVLPGSHGLSSGKFDCYWTESGVAKQRHGVDGTVTVNALALDGGTGDDFPASATADVVVNSQYAITVQSDGDKAVALCICADFSSAATITEASKYLHYCGLDLQDDGDATVKFFHLPPDEPVIWWTYCTYTNPLTGAVIESAKASNGSATLAAVLSILILESAI